VRAQLRARVGDVVVALAGTAAVVTLLAEGRAVPASACALAAVLLLLRRTLAWAPAVAPAVVIAGVLQVAGDVDSPAPFALLPLSAFLAGRRGSDRLQAATAASVVGSVAALVVLGGVNDEPGFGVVALQDLAYLSAPSLLLLSVGRRLAARESERTDLARLQELLAVEQQHRAERALLLQRRRISRELHDVVAQGAGAVVAQATAARLLVEQGRTAEAHDAVVAVEDGTREALADMRRLLGVLRPAQEPSS
jgi:signal transduction histidine kinase